MNRWIRRILCFMIVPGMIATGARADLVITMTDVNLAPGGTGTMDIMASSTDGDTLSQFNLGLLITPVSSPSFLYFSSGMDQPTPDFGNANYVFEGQSFAQDYAIPFWGDPSSGGTNYPDDTITGGDQADASAGPGFVTLTGTSLLATVQFYAPAGASGTFEISLVPTDYDPMNTSFTEFEDENGDDPNYRSTSGVVTISAVPEPSSLVMGGIAVLGALAWDWSSRCSRKRNAWVEDRERLRLEEAR